MSEYATIAGRCVAEIEEKKSRFIAPLAHVESEDEALAFLEEIAVDEHVPAQQRDDDEGRGPAVDQRQPHHEGDQESAECRDEPA